MVSSALGTWEDCPWLDLSLGLQAPRNPSKKMDAFLTSCVGESGHKVSGKARFSNYDVCWEGDIVALKAAGGWQVAKIIFLASTAGTSYAAIQPFKCVQRSKWHSSWEKDGIPRLADIFTFLETLVYRGDDSQIQVLHPVSLAVS